ncbi:uncharacterized protein LOC112681679 [Sipha flava]|uniref:Uncharacterized protein LOC112681679 n=1 Tax=Sipha flava TaxID=143950 RepID=A0A8B8FBF4_9HEMI|nr:uncharacterized protein LOC112681679 [Sipha flava]
MESLDLLNLRAGECSFLEIALADVRHYTRTFLSDDNKQVVLVYPPFNARNRFLIHTLVQNYFNELNTISIGNSYGRRTVVYHSSLKPMLCETLEESNEILDENDTNINRPYRTPNERKAQEKLLQSLLPKKKLDTSSKLTRRKQCKRPDIPIYIPKALRGLASNTALNTNSSSNNSNLSSPNQLDANSGIQHSSDKILSSKNIKSSSPKLNLNNYNVLESLNSFNFVDLTNNMVFDGINKELSLNDVSYQTSDPSSSNLSDFVNINEYNSNESVSNACNSNELKMNEIVKKEIPTLKKDELQFHDMETKFNSCNNISTTSSLPQNVSEIVGSSQTCTENAALVNVPDFQISDVNCTIVPNEKREPQINNITMDSKVDNIKINHDINLENVVVDSNSSIMALETEYNSNCLHYCLDDSFISGPLTDSEENSSKNIVGELIVQPSSVVIEKSPKIVENNEQIDTKKKKKKKKVINVDECSWEDLYDKEDDYIHPLLMKELVSTMGKVQVKCAKEDYRNHQTMEERSGDGECVIEVYGFSSDLKTVDLMNQFAAFRKKHFEIIWVNDTHALAVFESPFLADQALNTPFALVKTRPLKNAIKESKLKAETVTPLPATRPKTCSAMARRLVSSALGLKVNVSTDLLNAERTLLANAKEKKIRDAQLKHDIWNDEP